MKRLKKHEKDPKDGRFFTVKGNFFFELQSKGSFSHLFDKLFLTGFNL